MIYHCDEKRHLVCVLFSVDNLHKMAYDLGIKRCWYHSGKLKHYDIPKSASFSFIIGSGATRFQKLLRL
jgi:hypothetical protein